jgi:predicted DNA-binding transcriptional regulator AlpA
MRPEDETRGIIMTKYLSSQDIQARYRISRSTLYRWIENPEISFPEPVKIGHRILWREADLKVFDERIVEQRGPSETA